MLGDIYSNFYNYLRGSIFILSFYHLIIFLINRNQQFLYYSLYFFFLFLFFLGQGLLPGPYRNIHIMSSPSVHLATYIFYISFARALLDTPKKIPQWDKVLVWARNILVLGIFILVFLLGIWGHGAQKHAFMLLSPLFSVFALVSYVKFLRLKTKVATLFVFGSLLFFCFANLSYLAQIFYGFDGFEDRFGLHASFFLYVGALLEAVVFAAILGVRFKNLEIDQRESSKKIDELKRIVIKNHIVLKDKARVYISDLMYIKADDHYLNIFTSDGKNHYVRGKLHQIKEELPPNFIQCHRSYLVNINFIKQRSYNSLTLMEKTSIPVSRSFKNELD
ncbi:MAG: LytTR family transcriptional regulator DNA-binding domain-containing protein [Muricauda sp.]|nr:LytTR family transcriptional regulator DNA-binding domain-containing protein [Allomuricauda sp.]MBA4746867.1 LytTR family transcriptional regulator DNA-binding domain-containing protein [Allomuricauda sp.]